MGKIDAWVPKIPRLKNAKVSRFSYRDAAYTNDDIEGVENYDYARDMNVPSLTKTDTEASVLDSGARAQFSSLTKNALNHFFGRVSYNLNKVIDFLSDFLDDFISFTEIVEFNSSSTLTTYPDGTTKRLLNTSESNITILLPAGETYLESNTITLTPYVILTITKRGTVWINFIGNAATAIKANIRVSLRHISTWFVKTWTGLPSFDGNKIWTDGYYIYFSDETNQYVLDKTTSTWTTKTWTGLTDFDALYIWTDGENIYYSHGTQQYVLDKTTSTWTAKTWTGLTDFDGVDTWTDGENIYYSNGPAKFVLNKSTSTWTAKTWTGLSIVYGQLIWTDGENIYSGDGPTSYVLNKATSTWTRTNTWIQLFGYNGARVWTDGENTYYCYDTTQYVVDKTTSTWTAKIWAGLPSFRGEHIWTDGENIYYSRGMQQYVLPAKRHYYVDDTKYKPFLGKTVRCNCHTLSNRFVFANE